MATQVSLNSGAVASAGSLKLQTNGTTDAVTIDTAQNVGIGTGSPAGKLDARVASSGTNQLAGNFSNGVDADFQIQLKTSTTTIGVSTNTPLLFKTNDSEKMRLDASGNLGLGVTPSAWGSIFRAQQIGAGNSFIAGRADSIAGRQLMLGTNAYYNGTNWIYGISQPAARYYLSDNTHVWEVAPTGTAGNAITFTQAMTLDASGNLLVGRTSGSYRLDVGDGSSDVRARINGNTQYGLALQNGANSAFWIGSPGADALAFSTGGGTERARIDSSGNLSVGVNATVDSARLTVKSAQTDFTGSALRVQNGNGTNLFYALNNGDCVVPVGNLLVGTTGLDGRFRVEAASGASWARTTNHTNNGTQYFDSFRYNGTEIGKITGNNSNVSYVTSSDYRLKDNIQPMTNALATVALLKPCTYTWKIDGALGQGFIAHELQAVVPDAVVGEKDAVNEDGSIKAQGIDTSFLVATLTAAIQEQQAIIQQLQADVAALKG